MDAILIWDVQMSCTLMYRTFVMGLMCQFEVLFKSQTLDKWRTSVFFHYVWHWVNWNTGHTWSSISILERSSSRSSNHVTGHHTRISDRWDESVCKTNTSWTEAPGTNLRTQRMYSVNDWFQLHVSLWRMCFCPLQGSVLSKLEWKCFTQYPLYSVQPF